jgi:hypothetical protein
MRSLEGNSQKESSMFVKIDNDNTSPIGREGRICKTLRVYQLVPRVLCGAEIPTSSAEQAASMVALKAKQPSGNDTDPGPTAA